MAFAPSMPVATATPWYSNPMLYYLLAGMGGKLGGKGSWQEALGAMTQQGIAAKSQKSLEEERMEMVRKMLSGDPSTNIPTGASVTYGDKGMTLKMPTVGAPEEPAASPAPAGVITDDIRKQYINPLPSPLDTSSASLAGLTPQDVSRALTGAVSVESLRQTMLNRRAEIAKLYGGPLEQLYPIQVPGVGQVTHRQWTNLPAEEKEYAIYANAAKNLGDTDIMSREDWKMTEPTERERFIRAAMKDPKLMEAAKEVAEAGAMRLTLGDKLEEVKAKAGLKGQLYFKDPKWTSDVEKHISSEDVQNELIQYEPGSAEMIDAKARQKIKFIEDKISAGGGKIMKVKWAADGKTMIWTVRWPSGDTEAVRYAVRS